MKSSRVKSALALIGFVIILTVSCFVTKSAVGEPETLSTEAETERSYLVSAGYERYNDGYSDVYMATYDVALDDEWKSGRIYVEQWCDGACVKSVPWILSGEEAQINLNLRIPLNGFATEVEAWTDVEGGSWRMSLPFPEEVEIQGWSYEGYDADCELPLETDGSKVVAVLSFDTGAGLCEGPLEEPEKLQSEKGYAVAVRISFEKEAVYETLGQIQSEFRVDLSEAVVVDDVQKRKAYIEVLEQAIYHWIASDGSEWGPDGRTEFAIYDIDLDGREELLLCHEGYMFDTKLMIYDYDVESGGLYQELSEYPALTFYENGMVEAGLAHNQGMAPGLSGIEFWPYSLYQYNPATDVYEYVLQVDAWEKERGETSFTGDTYQADADADGNGMLYFIMTDGEHNYDEPTDDAEYQKWKENILGEPRILEIPFIELPLVLPEAAA